MFHYATYEASVMKRAYESLVKEYLGMFPCVGIVGARQCGKTTLLHTLPETWKRFDLERGSDYEVVSRDPDLFLRLNESKIAIDEAQIIPEIFPALRVAIDASRAVPGRFVVTGSSSPHLLRSISESLAGRIGIIELSPLSWSEIHPSKKKNKAALDYLLDTSCPPKDIVNALTPNGSLRDVHDYWFRGGYPEPWLKNSKRFSDVWTDQYIKSYLYRDIGRLFPQLNKARFRQFLNLLAGLSGTILNYSDIARTLSVSQPTVREYLDIAHGTFLWRKIPPFERNTMKRLVKHPRGYLRDTGLLHHLLRIGSLDALLSHPQMGRSWESVVVEELLRQLNSRGVSYGYSYYRTSAGAEVDLILEGDFGLLPVEIKYTQTIYSRSLRSLKMFVKDHSCRLGVVINNDTQPRLYKDNILGIPFAYL